MKISEIYSHVANVEGKTKQVSIGNIREIIGIVAELIAADTNALNTLYALGKKRSKKLAEGTSLKKKKTSKK